MSAQSYMNITNILAGLKFQLHYSVSPVAKRLIIATIGHHHRHSHLTSVQKVKHK